MLIKMGARPDLLADLSANEIEILNRQVAGVSTAFIDQLFSLLFNAESTVRHASQPRLAIEMVFFKIHQVTPALPIDLLIERLDSLLKDPGLQAVPGIVETQSTYGSVATQPLPDSPGQPHAPHGSRQGAVTEPAANAPQGDSPSARSGDPGSGDAAWNQVVDIIAKTKPSVAAALCRAQLKSVSQETFSLAVRDNDYTMKMVKKNMAMIETVCREHAGRGVEVDFSNGDAEGKDAVTVKQKADTIRQQLLNHPLVADAVDIFSGKIEEIKIR
jgi:DNA polymerase-3 subunit gamma/tau